MVEAEKGLASVILMVDGNAITAKEESEGKYSAKVPAPVKG